MLSQPCKYIKNCRDSASESRSSRHCSDRLTTALCCFAMSPITFWTLPSIKPQSPIIRLLGDTSARHIWKIPEAYEQIAKLMPNYKDRIEMVDATDLIRYEGCLNCASWVVEDNGDLQEVPVRL